MIIGVDGVPLELIKSYAEQGIMPNVKRLIDKYGIIQTQAPMPEVSSVSWTSFMTGMNPGENSIFGFMELNPSNYTYIFPSFRKLPVRTLWEVIGEKEKRSCVINLPGTYPVRPMKGILVSGFVALDIEMAGFPLSIVSMLKKMDYKVDADATRAAENKEEFLKSLHSILDTRYAFYEKVKKKEKWDLSYFIITETDRLHHFFFDAVENPQSQYYDAFLDFYRKVDAILGEITRDMEKKGIPFIILSDHGFVKIRHEVYISQYLKEWGYWFHLDEKPKNLEGITPRTKIFALDPSRLYIHLEGKYRRGHVKKEEYETLRTEVKDRFLGLEIDGERVIKAVFYKEEIYRGAYMEQAPDLVLLSNHGFDLKAGITKESFYAKTFFEGMHSQDNAMLIDSYGLELPSHPFIYEVGNALAQVYSLYAL